VNTTTTDRLLTLGDIQDLVRVSRATEGSRRKEQQQRHCVRCGRLVRNRNLGGHDGRPISGRVWCERCTGKVTLRRAP
jgi:hypothetical protein